MVRRLVRIALSLLYSAFVVFAAWLGAQLRRKREGRTVVLCYHGVRRYQRSAFANQMEQVAKAGCPVRLGEDQPIRGTAAAIAVTFDDAYASVLQNAVPELTARGIPATIFVPSEYLGKTAEWRMDGERAGGGERVMSAGEMRAAMQTGVIRIESHTVSHAALTQVDYAQLERELAESKRQLEKMTGQEVAFLSFPYGAYDERVLEAARRAGYTRVFSIEPTVSRPGDTGFLLGRVCVDPDDWPVEFWLKIRGGYEWVAILHRLGLWGRSGQSPVGYR